MGNLVGQNRNTDSKTQMNHQYYYYNKNLYIHYLTLCLSKMPVYSFSG